MPVVQEPVRQHVDPVVVEVARVHHATERRHRQRHRRADDRERRAHLKLVWRELGRQIQRLRMRHGDDGTFSRKDGTSFPAEYICTAIRDEAGNVMGAVVTFRDTTERKQLEEQLHRAQNGKKHRSVSGYSNRARSPINYTAKPKMAMHLTAINTISSTSPLSTSNC